MIFDLDDEDVLEFNSNALVYFDTVFELDLNN